MPYEPKFYQAMTSQAIAQAGTADSIVIGGAAQTFPPEHSASGRTGVFSMQITTTGAGTVKAELYVSLDGLTFVIPEGASAIITGKTAGTYVATMSVPLCARFKVRVTEANIGTVTVSSMTIGAM